MVCCGASLMFGINEHDDAAMLSEQLSGFIELLQTAGVSCQQVSPILLAHFLAFVPRLTR